MNFEKRKETFQKEMERAMNKYEVELYAANVCMPNGEVLPVLKLVDTKEITIKEDGDKTKEESTADSKA